MEKSFRIHTSIGSDAVIPVTLKQDVDLMEILSLKLRQKDLYKLHSSNYGVIVGRVLANDAFGIPNVKVSVFIRVEKNETNEIAELYDYSSVSSLDSNSIRYNLLPDSSNDDCYRIVGTFPSKTEVLNDDTKIEVFDKYWKYTTVTNQSGDYMIFGVPVGSQQVHTDLDLSDIGILSQKPRDMLQKGYTLSDFDNANQFKSSTNLNNLKQILSQNTNVYVYPFWGDSNNGIHGITRVDVQINYKFEPTCVFLGSIVSDNGTNAIGHECSPQKKSGRNAQLVTGEGTIEMIRKTPKTGQVEEYSINGNRLIDSDGVWCYQIPMNLDYVGTDEYGNICALDDPSKGIPTRTRVRFRISKDDNGDEGFSRHTAKLLVPNNPTLLPTEIVPTVANGAEVEECYNFGSNTPEEHFRDLYWNKVYSIKSYIPRFQTSNRQNTEYYSGLKLVNVVDNQNSVPFNKLNVKLPFMFVIVCILFKIVLYVVTGINVLINAIAWLFCPRIKLPIIGKVTIWCWEIVPCISFSTGLEGDDNVTYLPGCDCPDGGGCKAAECSNPGCTKDGSVGTIADKVEQKLALSYDIVHLDLYNDWVNGTAYMPLWYWRVRKKASYLFGLFTRSGRNEFCRCHKENSYKHINFVSACDLGLNKDFDYTQGNGGRKYHTDKDFTSMVMSYKGVIKQKSIPSRDNSNESADVFYYTSMIPAWNNHNSRYSDFSDYNDIKVKVIRTFATDIILLGSLDKNNTDGLPELFKKLPSSTVNIPSISSVMVPDNGNDDNTISDNQSVAGGSHNHQSVADGIYDNQSVAGGSHNHQSVAGGIASEEQGSIAITGMDWERNYDSDNPRYGHGLFMDLGCTTVSTKPKSCINASRLSELNVSLDMQFRKQYSDGNELQSGLILADGMITKTEIETNEGRAMFATMNHLGFLPTNVAEQKDKLNVATQIQNPNTSYYVNKFQFIYPTDFDGRLKQEAEDYTAASQRTVDYKDTAYLNFRFGKHKEDDVYHFYGKDNDENTDNLYQFPLYENSFYFYFGIKNGNTAIDKFRKTYTAECKQGALYPFEMKILTRPTLSCPSKDTPSTEYGFIYVNMPDIQPPYSYVLTDNMGNEVMKEDGINNTFLIIGTPERTTSLTLSSDTTSQLFYHSINGYPNGKLSSYNNGLLKNTNYTLTVTDINGESVTERFGIGYTKIQITYQTAGLSKKYTPNITKAEGMCTDNEYNGYIKFTSLIIDGKEYQITRIKEGIIDGGFSLLSGNSKSFLISIDGKSKAAQLDIAPLFSEYDIDGVLQKKNIDDCFCNPCLRDKWGNKNQLDIFVPGSYSMQVTQICNGELNLENTSNFIATIDNFTPFNVYLNEVPLNFIIGNYTNDEWKGNSSYIQGDISAPVSYNGNFYASTPQKNVAKNLSYKGWYEVFKENNYSFSLAIKPHENIWKDFITDSTLDLNTVEGRLEVVKYKFQSMFNLSNSVYFMNNKNPFKITYSGGVSPILVRGMRPKYEDGADVTYIAMYGTMNTITCNENHPNIVGCNYSCQINTDNKEWGYTTLPLHNPAMFNDNPSGNCPSINYEYLNASKHVDSENDAYLLGNYFAAFTNNGGIKVTNSSKVESIPVNADPYPDKAIDKLTQEPNFGSSMTHVYDRYSGKPMSDDKDIFPYMKTLFVDRRLDYDLLIIGGDMGANALSFIKEEDKKFVCGTKISGTTFNGIEMSYDENDNYNIIGSGDTNGGELEYRYIIQPSGQTEGNSRTSWIKTPNTPRRFYAASLNGSDIRGAFFNRYTDMENASGETSNCRWNTMDFEDKRPLDSDWFMCNNDDLTSDYPNRRGLLIDSLYPTNKVNLSITNCSYDISVQYTDKELPSDINSISGYDEVQSAVTGVIKGYVSPGETTNLDISLKNTVKFVAQDTTGNADVVMGCGKISYLPERGGVRPSHLTSDTVYQAAGVLPQFTAQELNLSFKMNGLEVDDYEIATQVPVLMTIPKIKELKSAISASTIDSFTQPWKTTSDFYDGNSNAFAVCQPSKLPDGVIVNPTTGFFENDDEIITDSNSSFSDIVLTAKVTNTDLIKSQPFTVVTNKYFKNVAEDFLLKRIHLISANGCYDIRPIEFSLMGAWPDPPHQNVVEIKTHATNYPWVSQRWGHYSYSDYFDYTIYKESGGACAVNKYGNTAGYTSDTIDKKIYTRCSLGVFQVTNVELNYDTTIKESGDTRQYFVFKLKYYDSEYAKNGTSLNEDFGDYEHCQFKFNFKVYYQGGIQEVQVDDPTVIQKSIITTTSKDNVTHKMDFLIFTVMWPKGVLTYSKLGGGPTEVKVYLKTPSGLSYNLNFKIPNINYPMDWIEI